jgi:hypothetical protein
MSDWGWSTRTNLNRKLKCYRLTPASKKQLGVEESKMEKLSRAVARIMWPAEEG